MNKVLINSLEILFQAVTLGEISNGNVAANAKGLGSGQHLLFSIGEPEQPGEGHADPGPHQNGGDITRGVVKGVTEGDYVSLGFEVSHRGDVLRALKTLTIDKKKVFVTGRVGLGQGVGFVPQRKHPAVQKESFLEHWFVIEPEKK